MDVHITNVRYVHNLEKGRCELQYLNYRTGVWICYAWLSDEEAKVPGAAEAFLKDRWHEW